MILSPWLAPRLGAVAAIVFALALPAAARQAPQEDLKCARALIDEKKPAEALEILRPLSLAPTADAETFTALGDALRMLRKYDDALKAYRRVEELKPDDTSVVRLQAMLHARLRQFPASEERYRRLLARNPSDLEARVGLAWVLSLQRKMDEALAEVAKALDAKPDLVDARIRLGWIRLWRHERREADEAFTRVLADHPGDVEAALGLAAVDLAQGRVATAEGHMMALARLHPKNVDVITALARIQMQRGHSKDAEATARHVVELQEDSIEALMLLGELAIRAGRFSEGERFYRQALALEPEDVAARTGLATALRRQGKREEAKEAYRSVLERDAEHANARIGLGWEFAWEGDYPAASAEFERILARDARNVDALAGLARVRFWQGRWAESEDLYERAVTADPWDDAARQGYDQALRAHESRAVFSFRHAEEFERDPESGRDALQLVTNIFSTAWRKRLSPETSFDIESRVTFLREYNRILRDDNFQVDHVGLFAGARHRLADHWTVSGRLGLGEFTNHDSRGLWRLPSNDVFFEAGASVAGEWSDHVVSLSWARSPLVIKDFPTTDLDVLALDEVSLNYLSPWWKDGITPDWHENQVEVTMPYTRYSDGNSKFGLDAILRHRWAYDNGWKIGPLVRVRYASFEEDVPFYYSFDSQLRLTIGAQVEYEEPGAWSFLGRYQATESRSDERVNPGSQLFNPAAPIVQRSTTVNIDGHLLEARVFRFVGDSMKAGIDASYSRDNTHYVTWGAGVFVEIRF
ncbi:MAG TPA: tetratricopeptide repeat protein [Planctomycetota bacterium]|nr:tetratricopeptide repeat protein [Planctomycetota bacterium]